MAVLEKGQKMPDFTFDTPFETGRTLLETAGRVSGKTALVFLRYYGCPLCQLDMRDYAQGHEAIAAAGGQMLVVLQSDPAKLAAQLKPGDLPYELICDPSQELYKAFSIAPASSQASMIRPKTLAKLARAQKAGLQHGDYEGDELQLPAVFVITPDGTVAYAHYARKVDDMPDAAELAALLK